MHIYIKVHFSFLKRVGVKGEGKTIFSFRKESFNQEKSFSLPLKILSS